MRGQWVLGIAVGVLVAYPAIGFAAEHGGKEHGGAPVASQVKPVEPTAEELRQSIRDYISQVEKEKGFFTAKDEKTGGTRTLTLVRVHDRVGKTGNLYYSCTDMKDASAAGDLLDLDFDVDAKGGKLNVVAVRIHKVNGQARYTYDDKDNRIPL